MGKNKRDDVSVAEAPLVAAVVPEVGDPGTELNPVTLTPEKRTWGTSVTVNGEQVNAPPTSTPPPKKLDQASALTFEMYCSVRKIPVMNKAGMRAFTKTQSATLQEWDRIFKAY